MLVCDQGQHNADEHSDSRSGHSGQKTDERITSIRLEAASAAGLKIKLVHDNLLVVVDEILALRWGSIHRGP